MNLTQWHFSLVGNFSQTYTNFVTFFANHLLTVSICKLLHLLNIRLLHSIDLDECTTHMCKGSPCTNSVGSYMCQCQNGFIFDVAFGCKGLKYLRFYFAQCPCHLNFGKLLQS